MRGSAEDGQFVVAQITEYPSKRRKAVAKIVEVLGDSTTPGLEIEVAVRSPRHSPSLAFRCRKRNLPLFARGW